MPMSRAIGRGALGLLGQKSVQAFPHARGEISSLRERLRVGKRLWSSAIDLSNENEAQTKEDEPKTSPSFVFCLLSSVFALPSSRRLRHRLPGSLV